jgi:hypothetical protein
MEKSRHLSPYDYLEVLQIEYIITELRRKIYVKRKDKDYYQRVLKGKKTKIEDICNRNSLPCIFSDSDEKKKYYQRVYPIVGFPNFFYKDKEKEAESVVKDFYYYYHVDTDFRILDGEVTRVGKLMSVDQEKGIVFIRLKGEEQDKPYSLHIVSRII